MEHIRLSETSLVEAAEKAAAVLVAGGVIAYPTDTVYGLGVALIPEAIAQVQDLKGREKGKPISILVASLGDMEACGTLTESARALAERHLPGPLTLVVKAKAHIPEELTQEGGIGIRIPDDAFCLALARAYGKPFTSTSANLAGHETPTTVDALIEHFGENADAVDLYIDGGERTGGIPSTVVSCLEEAPRILREGKLSRETLGL